MKITDEMVRKGAEALFAEEWNAGPEKLPNTWHNDRPYWETHSRACLEAALADVTPESET